MIAAGLVLVALVIATPAIRAARRRRRGDQRDQLAWIEANRPYLYNWAEEDW